MKRRTSVVLCLLVLSLVSTARAQESLERTITRLRQEIAVRESIDREAGITANHRAINRRLLQDRRSQLLAARQMAGSSSTKVERYHATGPFRPLIGRSSQQSSAAPTLRPRRVVAQPSHVAVSPSFYATSKLQSWSSGATSNVAGSVAANANRSPAAPARDPASNYSAANMFVSASERSAQGRTSVQQSRVVGNFQRERSATTTLDDDPCAGRGKLREIRIYWDTGSVSPRQLKHSGGYCVNIIGANTILYSYLIDVEAERPSGNPFDALNAAIGALKGFGGGGTALVGNKVRGDEPDECELTASADDVTDKATQLENALDNLLPKPEGGKYQSIALARTVEDFAIVRTRFRDLKDSVTNLRLRLSQPSPNCNAIQISAARTLVRDFADVEYRYNVLRARVDTPPPARVYEELEATDKNKITVRETYRGQQTLAQTLTLNIAPGYSLVSASAGFMVTRVPARSYSSRTAPDPANPTTATQNVLGIEGGSGTRPALTALLHYNLPFMQQRQFGLALSVGPVYDITGGKADTSKFGLFAGPSLRFSEWLYVTPGFHIGEFADTPQGFTRSGQVIPPNTGAPVPVKRYTTRFAFAMTFKVKDLGFASPPEDQAGK